MSERCGWVTDDPLYIRYHDEEWGVSVHDDRTLFEFLVLEGAQAGLSWLTILKRREGYRAAFAGFDPAAVARFDEARIDALTRDPGIVRHRGKIASAVNNARRVVEVQADHGSLDAFLWDFVEGTPIQNHWRSLAKVPTETPRSTMMSKALKGRGFSFVGPTTCYAFMQAVGMVDDHVVGCFRHGRTTA